MSQSKDESKPSPTTFTSLPREIRDEIYGYLAKEIWNIIAFRCPTKYGNSEGFEAIRKILHASTSTAQYAREAYEVFFHQNIFRIDSPNLPEFVNRKSHYLKNEGYFDVNAWIGSLEVIVHDACCDGVKSGGLANELRQLLVCPRLHTVRVQIQCSYLREEHLREILRVIAEVCAPLREKMGDRFKVETDGKERWGNGIRQQLSPWNLKSAASTS